MEADHGASGRAPSEDKGGAAPPEQASMPVNGSADEATALQEAREALAESQEWLRVTLESISDAVVTTDVAGRIRWFNPVAERMSGWENTAVRGRPLAEVLRFIDEEASGLPDEHLLLACLRDGVARPDHRDRLLISRDGTIYGIAQTAAPIRSADGVILGAVLVFHDVTQQRSLARELRNRATHDALTGLINRNEFEQHMERLLADAPADPPHCLLHIDLDQFKLINDACGHAAGDAVLRDIARLLGDAVRAGCSGAHDLVARIGGDEFAIVLERCDLPTAEAVGGRICAHMEDFRFVHEGRPFRLGTSIGLVVVDGRWTDLKTLLHAADTACYAAKESGRNRVHTWVESDLVLRRRSGETQWAARLADALDNDRLELYGQRIEALVAPDADLHCELLLRLRERDGTTVLPGALIAAAERFHMATRIDRWVISHALRMLGRARHPGARIGVISVNVSGQSIVDPSFREYVAGLLESTRVDVSRLCFELTETFAVTNLVDARAFVNEVRQMGAKVALDDFGAGASSFSYLKSLPVDYLKIDGQFVRNLLGDPLDTEVVRCFQGVARTLKVSTVAEWVEDEAVRQRLRELGVDHVQGFLIHRPEPFLDLLERYAGPLADDEELPGAAQEGWDLLVP